VVENYFEINEKQTKKGGKSDLLDFELVKSGLMIIEGSYHSGKSKLVPTIIKNYISIS
jgi:hypothetical protein